MVSLVEVQSTLTEMNTINTAAQIAGGHIPGRATPMQGQTTELEPSNPAQERRGHPRHRYIERLYIGKVEGTWFTAMTDEISPGGLAAATPTNLSVGEKVSLSPIVNKRVEAIVRRKNGSMYGFEFWI
jgi:hypothetical protein